MFPVLGLVAWVVVWVPSELPGLDETYAALLRAGMRPLPASILLS